MYGNLFVYDQERQLVAFESGSSSASRCLIFLGGLTDGLLALPYVTRLSAAIEPLSFSLIQPLLRSSKLQFGWHSINDDVEDLRALLE